MSKLSLIVAIGLLILSIAWMTPAKSYLYWTFINDIPVDTANLPKGNKRIIHFVEEQGKKLAPSYDKVVCTEYVIHVLENFDDLSESDKCKIRIITQGDLEQLVKADSDLIKGVSFYFTTSGKGRSINDINDAKSGDFIQFWNTRLGKATGHCGIIRAIDTDAGLISLYSSSPSTDGYGKQLYIIPDKYYIARIND